MILTGQEIERFVRCGDIVIEPYSHHHVEPNSYGFHLGNRLLAYTSEVINPLRENEVKTIELTPAGYLLEPRRFYLGYTHERMGGVSVATELYANCSTASAGIFIQTSAPLGHSGAVIHWTLEIVVAKAVRVYPLMRIGKICFWLNDGEITHYQGRYRGSKSVVSSRLFEDVLTNAESDK